MFRNIKLNVIKKDIERDKAIESGEITELRSNPPHRANGSASTGL